MQTRITIAKGDGIGPEIMDATLRLLEAAQCPIGFDEIAIGEKVYHEGHSSGIRPEAWDTLRRNGIFLKAPITTPGGTGYKSLNVTIRKTLGLFANVRPCLSMHPFVPTKHPQLDMIIIRENEEDLYAGIEHRQTNEVTQCLKLITRPGTERIMRYAFEYARKSGRRKVTCMAKDNIMKITDGLFRQVFEEVGRDYPDIQQDYRIIDIGSALIAERPEQFDVVVTTNLYGDIISDIAAQISGSVGMAGSSNIGEQFAMFEAIHGSAPDIAGKGIANPSGLFYAAKMMLVHMGLGEKAALIRNAWLRTIEEGIHTGDVYKEGHSRQRVGTEAFTDAVIARLGEGPKHLPAMRPEDVQGGAIHLPPYQRKRTAKTLAGVDVFIDWADISPDRLGQILESHADNGLRLKMITNRGVKVYPDGLPETFCTDHWRCRFVSAEADTLADDKGYSPVTPKSVIGLLSKLSEEQIDIIKTENLYLFEGERGFSLGQGE